MIFDFCSTCCSLLIVKQQNTYLAINLFLILKIHQFTGEEKVKITLSDQALACVGLKKVYCFVVL